MSDLRCGLLAAWANAFFAGRVSLDQVVDAVTGSDAAHQVVGLPCPAGSAPALRDVLVRWRRSGAPVRVVLPVPGDVRGLAGPPEFRALALDAGEAVLGADLGITPVITVYAPSSAPASVVWHASGLDAVPLPPPESVRDVQHELTAALRESASALAAAELAGSRSADLGSALQDARRAGERLRLPPRFPPDAVALLAQAERMTAVLRLTAADPIGGAVDRAGITARADVLRPLANVVRRARMTAYNAT